MNLMQLYISYENLEAYSTSRGTGSYGSRQVGRHTNKIQVKFKVLKLAVDQKRFSALVQPRYYIVLANLIHF